VARAECERDVASVQRCGQDRILPDDVVGDPLG
jgi:hypothetical protein